MNDHSEREARTSDTATHQECPIKGVALLLLAVAVISGGVAYGVASWQNRSVVALKDAVASQQ